MLSHLMRAREKSRELHSNKLYSKRPELVTAQEAVTEYNGAALRTWAFGNLNNLRL